MLGAYFFIFVNRKYIPVNAEKVADMGCYRGFVDVFSPNIDADGAFACCTLERENPSICEPPVSLGKPQAFLINSSTTHSISVLCLTA